MTVYSLLLERLWLLGGALIALQFLLIAIWSWRRTPRAALAVRVGFVAAVALLVLSYFVQTPRERMESVCRQLADAIAREDAFVGSTECTGVDFQQDVAGFRFRHGDVFDGDLSGSLKNSCFHVVTSPLRLDCRYCF